METSGAVSVTCQGWAVASNDRGRSRFTAAKWTSRVTNIRSWSKKAAALKSARLEKRDMLPLICEIMLNWMGEPFNLSLLPQPQPLPETRNVSFVFMPLFCDLHYVRHCFLLQWNCLTLGYNYGKDLGTNIWGRHYVSHCVTKWSRNYDQTPTTYLNPVGACLV